MAEPGGGLLVSISSEGVAGWPRESLLYDVNALEPATLLSDDDRQPALIEAEAFELERRDYPGAILRYRRLLASAGANERAELLHHLARTYRKSGRPQEALTVFQQLPTASGLVGGAPAGLIGHYEVCAHWAAAGDRPALASCAVDLYARLVAGEWLVSKERYSYYAATARDWAVAATVPASTLAALAAREHAKAVLTASVDALSRNVCGSVEPTATADVHVTRDVVAVVRCLHSGATGSGSMLVISHAWLADHVWPVITAGPAGGAYHVALIGRDNQTLYSSRAESGAGDRTAHTVTRDILNVTQDWRVRVWPRDVDVLTAGLVMRERLYLLTLALVIASLTFGAYATHRVVTRELQFARLKSDFVATVSHEFRSPLTAIRQLGEVLMRGRVPESRRPEYYERITRESERLGRLVENVLDFAQMEEGRKRYHLQPLDTTDWLQRTVSEFQSLREGNSATVTATIPPSLPALQADPAALSCAIHNLLDNAIKYSPGTDTVWLEAEAAGPRVTIRVRDCGVGISESDRRQIFEKFFRANGEITRQVKGAGLGLSLVHHIVAAHNGRIDCESQPGQGTTFSIHLTAETAPA